MWMSCSRAFVAVLCVAMGVLAVGHAADPAGPTFTIDVAYVDLDSKGGDALKREGDDVTGAIVAPTGAKVRLVASVTIKITFTLKTGDIELEDDSAPITSGTMQPEFDVELITSVPDDSIFEGISYLKGGNRVPATKAPMGFTIDARRTSPVTPAAAEK